MRLLMVGAGGHGRAVADLVADNGHTVAAYAARTEAGWLEAPWITDGAALPEDIDAFVMGLGGIDPAALRRRLDLYRAYHDRGLPPITLAHSRSAMAPGAALAEGAMVLAGAILNAGTAIDCAAIVNTGAIVEHEARIGAGAHVAPGAIVLGAARIGDCAMVGAGAVVLPGAEVPAGALVPALTRYPG